ncbi:alpha/beta fold hydrolase [Peribacillus sp. SCS-26]|uniref:alpha/beta fold hydrolase n=1 Tax=Paraperibacillus marinus TaxID=3115295 RepID=UPI003905B1A5
MEKKSLKPEQDFIARLKKARSAIHSPLPEMGTTKREAVWKKNKSSLWYYAPKRRKYSIPVFMVYSLINKPVILDLGPGNSLIEAFINEGFDVYLLDFGSPGYEDSDIDIDDYILDYIQPAAKRVLRHSKARELTVIGYCLGGTIAAMYAAIAQEPIKNLILITPPLNFDALPEFDEWVRAMKEEEVDFTEILDLLHVVPGSMVNRGISLMTSPIHSSIYLSLLSNIDNPEYVGKWRRFNEWTIDHVPLTSAAMKQMLNGLIKDNQLMSRCFNIRGKRTSFKNIAANLLVIAGKGDQLIPEDMIKPAMDLFASADKTYLALSGGHTTLSKTNGLPEYLDDWLPQRSGPR